ncbi:unnamed protein product (macronuclear) [Paramecium tetraurelia]|uniref:non-specific serine/threonine protein kinase n=1 Tax=Paramecium tetraurelia TaxID=5888 RepID=A0DUC6_PARTE|nr:uncharacterized protein GSPATT00020315001 [Paramecium tetraurelia]CAK86643.1 unnamed protein product [Paramecium tetraurelia]|eukprot:XP_001454040.1 hypothetical protein (macronuclear) [Paramecium tetraurelia strain d4-2]
MSLKDFKIISKLGDGSYSNVYKVRRIEDNLEYALKKVNLTNLSDKEKQNALNEVRILASIHHQNIISYKEAFIDPVSNSLCIVMELATDGDLLQKIQKYIKTNSQFQEKEILKYAFQILNALKALHQMKVMHRDIKSANIFLINNEVKLGDLNVSKVAKQGLLYTQTGTPYYASPEVWKDQPYDCKSDIWSLGCVLYEMAALKLPFQAENMDGLYNKVIKGYYQKLPKSYTFDLQNLIRMMLQVSTVLRPTATQLLELNCFKNFQLTLQNAGQLIKTIQFPKNKSYQNIFPKSTYKQDQQNQNEQVSSSRKRLATLGGGNDSLHSNPTRLSQYEQNIQKINKNHQLNSLDLQNLKQDHNSLNKILSEGYLQSKFSKLAVNSILQEKIRKQIIMPSLQQKASPFSRKISSRQINETTILPCIL